MSHTGRRQRDSSPEPRRSRRDYDSDGSDAAPPPASNAPRRSSLKDPNRSGPRSQSRVRVSDGHEGGSGGDDSDAGSVIGQYVKHRDGKIDFMPSGSGSKKGGNRGSSRRSRDLEDKNEPSHTDFRQRRNGYESDEGDTLKDARRRPGPGPGTGSRRTDDDDRDYRDDDQRGPGPGPGSGRRRPHPRGYQSDDDDVPTHRRGDRGRGDDGRSGVGRGEGGRGGGGNKGDLLGDAAFAAGTAALGYGASRAARRRESPRGHGDYGEDRRRPPRPSRQYDDRGYDSDRPRRSRYADDDAPPRRRGGGSDRHGSSRYEDDRYSDRLPQRTKSDRRSRRGDDPRMDPGKPDWKKQGIGLFQEQLMPVIKKEGGRMAMKQLSKFLAN